MNVTEHADLFFIVDRLAEDYCPQASIEHVIRTARTAFFASNGDIVEIERLARLRLNQTASNATAA